MANKKLTFNELHQAFQDMACPPPPESLPKRWIDLLRYLDVREREEVPQTKPQSRAR
jgi:hypothetical protein